MNDKTIKIIKAVLNKEKTIEFAYLFGSFMSEKKHNDIDIRIYTHEGIKENSLNITSNLKNKISRKLKESNIPLEADEIDVTLLNSVNFKFMARIFRERLQNYLLDIQSRTKEIEKLLEKFSDYEILSDNWRVR